LLLRTEDEHGLCHPDVAQDWLLVSALRQARALPVGLSHEAHRDDAVDGGLEAGPQGTTA
jgi:hypothetical protein